MEAVQESVRTKKQLESDERWMLAQRIVRSARFSRSDRLSEMLLYICRLHLAGRDDEINEQRIGIAVFGRVPSFDSGSDSIVRSHATRLRQRLEFYFMTEGIQEPLHLEIPRGGYVPRFFHPEPKNALEDHAPVAVDALLTSNDDFNLESPGAALSPAVVGHAPPPTGFGARPWLGIAIVAIALVAIIGVSFFHRESFVRSSAPPAAAQSKAEQEFWASLFTASRPTLVVTGDSGLVLYETVAKREISISDYISGRYLEPPAATTHETDTQVLERELAAHRNTSVVDLDLSVRLTHLPEWTDEQAKVVFARDLRPGDAARSNLILIGSRTANPWVGLVDGSMNFVLAKDDQGHFYYLNRHPLAGEKAAYVPSRAGSTTADSSVYGLIYYRPGTAGMSSTLVLSGLWMSGTEATGNFVLNHREFAQFLSTIARPDGTIPPFELLIQLRSLADNAVGASIVAKRVGSSN